MSLKVIMLRHDLTEKNKELEELRKAAEGFATREGELEKAIEEITKPEERSVVEGQIAEFEKTRDANTADQTRITGEIADIEKEIKDIEERTAAAGGTGSTPAEGAAPKTNEKRTFIMENAETRTDFFGMTISQRDAFMARDDIKEFATRLRELGKQNRSVSGADLGIPTVMLDMLRSNINEYSKLVAHVMLRKLKGKARQTIAGTVPEAVWTEAIANLNELNIVFTQLEVDGYKVGGFIAIPNSLLEDDEDVDLLQYVITLMGQAIGKAVDKAIIYGDGSKKPVGIVTRLAAESQPSWWGNNQGDFTDLHSSNIKKLNIGANNGVAFFQELIVNMAIADPEYSMSEKPIWVMSRKTHMDIMSRALDFNAAAALMAGFESTFPVVGGDVIELNFMPDYEIVGGFFDDYLLVERAGANIRSSDIPMMVQDQTLVTATQRYDGKPSRGEAFVIINYTNVAATTSKTFETDYANTEIGTLGVTCAANADTSGKTDVTVTGATSGATLKYKTAGEAIEVANGKKIGTGWTTIESGGAVTAAAGVVITVVEINSDSRAVKVGNAVSVPKA